MIQTYDIFVSDGALVSERHPHGAWCNAGEVEAHIAAQAATIELLRAECKAYRALTFHLPLTSENFGLRDAVNAARAAVDSARALEDK